jgi:hypothetical protein
MAMSLRQALRRAPQRLVNATDLSNLGSRWDWICQRPVADCYYRGRVCRVLGTGATAV